MATQENISPRQLELARKALWHQNGDALRTLDSVRDWLNEAGLVPVYPHAQFATPAPSFEAVLGRPENGWVPTAKKAAGAVAVADEEEEFDVDEAEDEDDDFAEDAEDESSKATVMMRKTRTTRAM